MIKGIAT